MNASRKLNSVHPISDTMKSVKNTLKTKFPKKGVKESDEIELDDLPINEDEEMIQRKLICHVPDFVWNEVMVQHTPQAFVTDGVLLFADVSGFTALTEKYSTDKEGVSGLTSALNNYISSICEHILLEGGDILKFAGDAILAIWRCQNRTDIKHAIAVATRTALEIQHKDDYVMTSVGVELRVKIAISAGKIFCIHVGSPGQMRHIAMSGNPVGEVNAAEKHCSSGEVVMSPNALELCDRNIYKGQEVGSGHFKFFKVSFMTSKDQPAWDPQTVYKKNDDIQPNVRLALNLHKKQKLEEYIRQYISSTVQAKIDDRQELGYLSEIRQCTILFINLVFDLKEQRRDYTEKLGSTLQSAFVIVDDTLRSFGGEINKLFMFDKGCTFLAAFGLPGKKNEREAAFALQCAFQISKAMTRNLAELDRVSIGVTTGSVYVGVIGHESRHEYSFLGPKVNMAARIMMAGYGGMVNCDSLTMKCSNLSRDYFIPQPYKALKGIQDPGTIFQYLETVPNLTSYLGRGLKPEHPILGRIVEIDNIMTETNNKIKPHTFVMIQGDKGMGKTRLLDEVVILCQNLHPNLHMVHIMSAFDIMKDTFKMVRIVIEDLLGIIDSPSRGPNSFAQEELAECLIGSRFESSKGLLDPVFGTCFGYNSQTSVADEDLDNTQALLSFICLRCLDNFERVCVAIDNGQFIDNRSLEILQVLADDQRFAVMLTTRPPAQKESVNSVPPSGMRSCIKNKQNLVINLLPLANEYFPALICQQLRVSQVQNTLAAGIMYKSYGNPGWCNLLLKKLKDDNVINIKEIAETADENDTTMHVPPIELVTPRRYTARRGVQGENLDKQLRETIATKKISQTMIHRSVMHRKDPRATVNGGEGRSPARSSYKHPALHEGNDEDVDLTRKGVTQRGINSIIKKVGGFYETMMNKDASEDDFKTLEGVITNSNLSLTDFMKEIHSPEVIKSFILEQMDRLPPMTQHVCKCAALVGTYFSRQIIFKLIPGAGGAEKVNKAFRELIEAQIIEPISTLMDHLSSTNSLAQNSNTSSEEEHLSGDGLLKVATSRKKERRSSFMTDQIKVKKGFECNHLRFKNNFYREVIDQLWLNHHRLDLHQRCSLYFTSCVNELKSIGQVSNRTITEFSVHFQMQKDDVATQNEICKILMIPIELFNSRKIQYDKKRVKNKLMTDDHGLNTMFIMSNNLINFKDFMRFEEHKCSSTSLNNEFGHVFGDNSPLWFHIPAVDGTIPPEVQLFLSMLHPVLCHHFRKGKDTLNTVVQMLESAEAFLKTESIRKALHYLEEAIEVIDSLDKGKDVIQEIKKGDVDHLHPDRPATVLMVPRDIRARYYMLLADAKMKEMDIAGAKPLYMKALNLERENLSWIGQGSTCYRKKETSDHVLLNLWNRISHLHICQPEKDSRFGNYLIKRLDTLCYTAQTKQDQFEISTNMLAVAHVKGMTAKVAEIEKKTLNIFKAIDSITWDALGQMGRFLNQLFFVKISDGKIPQALRVAHTILQVADASGCKNLALIARCLLCEVYTIQNDSRRFEAQFASIDAEFACLPGRNIEIDCWTTIIKFSQLLVTGSSPQTFSELVIWTLPYGGKSFTNTQWLSLSIMISLVKTRLNAFDAAFKWLAIADDCLARCPMSYHVARALVHRTEIDLIMFRNTLFCNSTLTDWKSSTKSEENQAKESLKKLKSVVDIFPVFRCYFILYQAIFKHFKSANAKQTEKEINSAMESAKNNGNESARLIISHYKSYYTNNETRGLYAWPARIIYAGRFEEPILSMSPKPYLIPKL